MADIDRIVNNPAQKVLDELSKASVGLEKFAGYHMPDFLRPSTGFDTSRLLDEIGRAQAEAKEAPTARRAVRRIEEEIRKFEAMLDDASEVGIRLVTFGQNAVVHIETIDYWQPNLIVFVGHLDSDRSPVRLIQHISQLSFLLVKLPRLEPEKPRRPIGFTAPDESEG